MKKLLPGALCGITLLLAAPAAPAENAVAAAVQRLHLSPQQLLSLRDFLGAFSRGVAVEASGGGLFVLRDAGSMAYAGEFSLRTDTNATLIADRIGGPATLDSTREIVVPLRLDAKARLQATAALADSQALTANGRSLAVLPQQQIEGAAPTNGAQAASVLQSRGVFFRDGSGYAVTVRASIPAAHAAPAPLRITERYYAPIRSDGKDAWRPAIVEIGGDVTLGFAEFERRYACPAPGPCTIRGSLPAPANLHAIRWGKQSITAVPVTLMAQLIAPAPTPPTANTTLGPPAETAPQTPPADASAAPSDSPPPAPDHPSGT